MSRPIATTLVCLTLAAASSIAFADAPRERQPHAFSRPTERIEARLAYIRTALKITDAQQAQWSAFADSMRQRAAESEKKMQDWRQKMAEWRKDKGMHERQRPSLIERLDRAQKMHADAIARLNSELAVVKPLYDSLSAEQKKVADVVLAPHHRGGHAGGHGMRGRPA